MLAPHMAAGSDCTGAGSSPLRSAESLPRRTKTN